MASRLSPTANLLRKSRLFTLPKALVPTEDPPTSKSQKSSDSATLPHPIRASIVTPASSLSRGDWGLKRSIPSKATSNKSDDPVIRMNSLDTFEHVTDFDSASDHTMTLQKIQELDLPVSLPSRVNYSSSMLPKHVSPFETECDNTHLNTEEQDPSFRQYRHAGPWLFAQTNSEFNQYLKTVGRDRDRLLGRLHKLLTEELTAKKRKEAQDNGEDLEAFEPVMISPREFQRYIKSLRVDPSALGPVIFKLLDLPTLPPIPSARMTSQYFAGPPTRLSSPMYATNVPPKTHPSAGLSYRRTHAPMYNHPRLGPQAHKRPVWARILRPRGRFRGRNGKAIAGIAGVTVEDLNALAFADQTAPAGLSSFDASIPGGGKYWANPVRISIDSKGSVNLSSFRASSNSMAPYGLYDYRKPSESGLRDVVARGGSPTVPTMNQRPATRQPLFMRRMKVNNVEQPRQDAEALARSLMGTIRGTTDKKD